MDGSSDDHQEDDIGDGSFMEPSNVLVSLANYNLRVTYSIYLLTI
jgi:hypothetical protein